MPQRYHRPLVALCAACALSVALSACTGVRVTQVETEVRGLKEELVELRRGQTAQRVQFDDFRNRLVVLQDKLDSERLANNRRGAATQMPELPRVIVPRVVAPHADAPGSFATSDASRERASRTIVIGPDNVPRVTDTAVAARGKRTKSGRSARRTVAAGPRADGGDPTPQDGVTAEERAAGAYRAAKSLLDAGRLREARDQFATFSQQHPKHPLADNAMYWIGETWYAQAMWIKAAGVFHTVVRRYASGNKVPDALLKMALCYAKLGERADSQAVLGELIRRFPTTPAADFARRKLTESRSNGAAPRRP